VSSKCNASLQMVVVQAASVGALATRAAICISFLRVSVLYCIALWPRRKSVSTKPAALACLSGVRTCVADPNMSSGLEVARMTMSTSSLATPAISRAFLALDMEWAVIVSPLAST
jgi:hypothetical protein